MIKVEIRHGQGAASRRHISCESIRRWAHLDSTRAAAGWRLSWDRLQMANTPDGVGVAVVSGWPRSVAVAQSPMMETAALKRWDAPPQLLLSVEGIELGRHQKRDAAKRQRIGQLLPDQEAEHDGPDYASVAEGSDGGYLSRAQRVDHAQMADEREYRSEEEGKQLAHTRHLPGLEHQADEPGGGDHQL